jgi:hypothetical protein
MIVLYLKHFKGKNQVLNLVTQAINKSYIELIQIHSKVIKYLCILVDKMQNINLNK